MSANLLAERIAMKKQVELQAFKKLAALGLILAFGLVVLPLLARLRSGTMASTTTSNAWREDLARQRAALEQQLDATKPQAAEELLIATSTEAGTTATSHVLQVLNAAGDRVLFTEVSTAISIGTMTITMTGVAESYAALREFVDRVGEGPDVDRAVLISTSSGDTLGPESIMFELQKVVTLGQ